MSVESLVLREECDGIVTLTLNRPRQQNALSEAMLDQLQAALDEVGRSPRARVIVLGGAGPIPYPIRYLHTTGGHALHIGNDVAFKIIPK